MVIWINNENSKKEVWVNIFRKKDNDAMLLVADRTDEWHMWSNVDYAIIENDKNKKPQKLGIKCL